MRSASAEPCGTSPGVRFGNAAQTLHSICPHSTTAAAAKRGTICKARCSHHHCMATSNVASPSATPRPLLCANRAAPQPPKPWRPPHPMPGCGPSSEPSRSGPHAIRPRSGPPHRRRAKTSPRYGPQRLAAPAVIPTTTVLSRRAAGGTLLATTSAAANRGRDTPNTGRITAPASTPPPSCPAADQGWNCRLSKKYLRR